MEQKDVDAMEDVTDKEQGSVLIGVKFYHSNGVGAVCLTSDRKTVDIEDEKALEAQKLGLDYLIKKRKKKEQIEQGAGPSKPPSDADSDEEEKIHLKKISKFLKNKEGNPSMKKKAKKEQTNREQQALEEARKREKQTAEEASECSLKVFKVAPEPTQDSPHPIRFLIAFAGWTKYKENFLKLVNWRPKDHRFAQLDAFLTALAEGMRLNEAATISLYSGADQVEEKKLLMEQGLGPVLLGCVGSTAEAARQLVAANPQPVTDPRAPGFFTLRPFYPELAAAAADDGGGDQQHQPTTRVFVLEEVCSGVVVMGIGRAKIESEFPASLFPVVGPVLPDPSLREASMVVAKQIKKALTAACVGVRANFINKKLAGFSMSDDGVETLPADPSAELDALTRSRRASRRDSPPEPLLLGIAYNDFS